jgi:RNA polymerase sigma-70 factor (ECF subfamily)
MFFRNPERHSVLDLEASQARGGELAASVIVSGQQNLSTEDKVKQYYEQMREPVSRYVAATFGDERGLADEITQDAFLQLFRYLNSGHVIQNVRGWIFRVAHNLAVNRIRAQKFILPMTDEDWEHMQSSLEAVELNPEQTLQQKEVLQRLRRAIGQLTLAERECLNLRTKGFRYREIGEILDLSTRSVANTIHRVIDKLQRELNG